MYCKYCGKQTDNQDGVCSECEKKNAENRDEFFDAPPSAAVPMQDRQTIPAGANADKMLGFGKALLAVITGCAGYFLSVIAVSLIYGRLNAETLKPLAGSDAYFYTAIALGVVALGAAVVGVIFGILSLRCFTKAKNEGGVKPIPTFVLGLIATISSGITFFMATVSIFSPIAFLI